MYQSQMFLKIIEKEFTVFRLSFQVTPLHLNTFTLYYTHTYIYISTPSFSITHLHLHSNKNQLHFKSTYMSIF